MIGVSRSEVDRRIFEDTFSQRLHAAGIRAIASYTLIPESGEIPPNRIEEVVARVGADGVLVTRVQRVEQRVEVSPGFGAAFYNTGFYNWYDVAWASVPPDISTMCSSSKPRYGT